ncbi:MAG: hypothetical protein LKJ90_01315 [Faecalibacterium sp.]|nr:hypothetical protein [Faecalibacterium sp.]
MKNAENARDDFWLDLGPAAGYADMDAEATAAKDGDVSPDGALRGFTGAEQGTVYEPSRDKDCGCGKGDGCGCGKGEKTDAPDHNQVPDVNTDTIPPEVPPLPPETWPGL